jgi:hypothetical protein
VARRLIIVARGEDDLFDSIRRDTYGDESVRVITDRRIRERRQADIPHAPERRRADRRRIDIEEALRIAGWAEVEI